MIVNQLRKHDYDGLNETPCWCGYVRVRYPDWAIPGKVFGLNRKMWRVVCANCSVNSMAGGEHFINYAICEEIGKEERWSFPPAGSTVTDLGRAISKLQQLTKFSAEELKKAVYSPSSPGNSDY